MKEKDKKELMVKKAFVLYPDQWPALSNLSAQKLGLLFEAIFRTLRGEQGATLKLDGKVKLAYDNGRRRRSSIVYVNNAIGKKRT